MSNEKIKALINLLDDPSQDVFENVSEQLKQIGEEARPYLQEYYGAQKDPVLNQRIEKILNELEDKLLLSNFTDWVDSTEWDMIWALAVINMIYYPDTGIEDFRNKIDGLKQSLWMELGDDLTSFETIKTFNRIFFEERHMRLNRESKHTPKYFFPQTSLEMQLAEAPILSLMYAALAQSLNIPVHGVNLPGVIMLAYRDPAMAQVVYSDSDAEALFYINPYDTGKFVGREYIEKLLKAQKLKQDEAYFQICTNLELVRLYLRMSLKMLPETKAVHVKSSLKAFLEICENTLKRE